MELNRRWTGSFVEANDYASSRERISKCNTTHNCIQLICFNARLERTTWINNFQTIMQLWQSADTSRAWKLSVSSWARRYSTRRPCSRTWQRHVLAPASGLVTALNTEQFRVRDKQKKKKKKETENVTAPCVKRYECDSRVCIWDG